MKHISIQDLAYKLKNAKENNQPQPIFFLGAGASVSGDIPLASEITAEILEKFSDDPSILRLSDDDIGYSKLMSCLEPFQRDELLKSYINKAQINVAHIYLAQLFENNFVDYVLTVNFDNLLLRALGLYNIFPSTYDMAILKDLTTTSFKKKSVVYLHGQHHGLWLLNTAEEMAKIKTTVPRILDSIKNQRPWVFIGYSGDDPIFDYINSLGRFDNGLYWVSYLDNLPSPKVQKFLNDPNKNTFIINGHDADSFMLELCAELKLEQPNIINKPFTVIDQMLDNIVDIQKHERFAGVDKRLQISKRQVLEARTQFEDGNFDFVSKYKENSKVDKLHREIIQLIIQQEFSISKIQKIENEALKIDNSELNKTLCYYYLSWASLLGDIAQANIGNDADRLYHDCYRKYSKASEFNSSFDEVYFNWGVDMYYHAEQKKHNGNDESDEIYSKATKKFKKTIKLNPKNCSAFNYWGVCLGEVAKTGDTKDSDDFFEKAYKKYIKALAIDPKYYFALNNWGSDLCSQSIYKNQSEASRLHKKGLEKIDKAISINPAYDKAYLSWAKSKIEYVNTFNLPDKKIVFCEAIEKLKQAVKLNPNSYSAFSLLGSCYYFLANIKPKASAKPLYSKACESYDKAIKLNPDVMYLYSNAGVCYAAFAEISLNKESKLLMKKALHYTSMSVQLGAKPFGLSCIFASQKNDKQALFYLEKSLQFKEVSVKEVMTNQVWQSYSQNKIFKRILNDY